MKPLTLEETALLEEMKDMCLKNGDYIDENAKARFYMLCHLEDFGIENWELKQENKQLKEQLDKYENLEDMTLRLKMKNEKLKKQLHEASITIQEMVEQDIECPSNCEKLRILKKQHEKLLNDYCRLDARKYSEQEEFIKYMNSCIKELKKESTNKLQNTINLGIKDIAKIILQKYKEIIGVSDENNIK